MSSHHIVRDAQEPALVIIDTNIAYETIGQLLEWSPVVIVVESCLEEVLKWGIKIDKIICQDIHYQQIYELSLYQQPLQIFGLNSPQITDYIHFALRYLSQNGHTTVSLVGEGFAPEDFIQYIDSIEIIIYQNDYKGYFVKKGIFNKWITIDTKFFISEKEALSGISFLEEVKPYLYKSSHTGLISFKTEKTIFIQESF